MEQKNLLLAIALSLGFLLFWQWVVMPRFAPRPAPVPPAEPAKPAIVPIPKPAIEPARGSAARPREEAERILRDRSDEIVFSPAGGGVRHWRVKSRGQQVDLVLDPLAEPLPLSTFPGQTFAIATREREAVLTARLSGGMILRKTLRLAADGHLHDLELEFRNPAPVAMRVKEWSIGWGPGIGTVDEEAKENPQTIRALAMSKLRARRVEEDRPVELGRWAGIDNRYFLAALVPQEEIHAVVSSSGKKESTRLRISGELEVPAKGSVALRFKLYVGPKGYTQLKTYGLGLQESVDFGWFSGLGKFLLAGLYRLKNLTGNYGWSIILITLVINILMIPLTVKSFRATMAMKKLQPKIAELQKRFKDDPKRLQMETMNLYKTGGANPFGGCLPMLLQMPIFVAFFNTLRNAYELRGAPFILWIRDLSQPDKVPGMPQVHVLPLIMGVGMFLQQRMSGASTDPTQRQMMYIFPVVFTVMLYSMPSGLVIYWLTNSLLMMAFQYVFMKTHQKPAGTPGKPIIERR